jgi:hypothetical protein
MAAPGELVLYLTLAPEFGGTRFGPFEGIEARLGADRERCHITLPESLGVAREHCKVLRQGGNNLILTPSERTAAVFLWKGDARRPTQIQTPTAVRPGDSFSLVTPEGPRFIVELGPLPPEMQAQRSAARKRGPGNLTADGFANAGKDLLLARLYTLSPVSLLMRAKHFVTSGAIWQPRILLLMAVSLGGYVGMGASGCSAMKYKRQLTSVTQKSEECNQQLEYAKNVGGNVENFAFDELALTITGAVNVGGALKKDPALLGAVRESAKQIAADPSRYSWLLDQSARSEDFAAFRERIAKTDDFDPDTKRLLPFVAATSGRVKGEFERVKDSADTEVCGRGPARLTYRQARNLGFSNVSLDAFVGGDATSMASDDAARAQLLGQTASAAGENALTEAPASAVETITAGAAACIRAEGEDDRGNLAKTVSGLVEQVGKDADFVPDAESTMGAVARLAKFYAADIPNARYTDAKMAKIDFRRGLPSTVLQDEVGGDWVQKRVADVIARAIVLPCDGVLNGERARAEAVLGTLPEPVPCLVLNYRLTHE